MRYVFIPETVIWWASIISKELINTEYFVHRKYMIQ